MGAMHNDLNRCNYMFSDDRRCCNLIHTPGAPFCYFHAKPRSKKPKPDSAADGAADRALFQWLAAHPLDSVTHVNQAVNLIALLLAGKRISVRRGDALLRLFRVAMKSVPDIHEEFTNEYRRRHWPQGDRFLREIQPLLVAASPNDPQPSPDPSPDPGPAAPASPPPPPAASSILPPTAAAIRAPSRTGSQPVRPSVPTQNSTAGTPPLTASSSQRSAHAAHELGSPLPTPAPPAPPSVAPLPSPSGAAQPNRGSLPADLSEKEVRSILRALLVAAASASLTARKHPAPSPGTPQEKERAARRAAPS